MKNFENIDIMTKQILKFILLKQLVNINLG